jgi:hypothetical protein
MGATRSNKAATVHKRDGAEFRLSKADQKHGDETGLVSSTTTDKEPPGLLC